MVKLLFMSGLRLGVINLNNKNYFEKVKQRKLMFVTQHSKKWWDWCVAKDAKKEIEPFFVNEKFV